MAFKVFRLASVIIGCMIFGMLMSTASYSQDLGSIGGIQGNASLRQGDRGEFSRLKTGDSIALNDSVQTDRDSKAWVRIADGSHNSLGEYSEVYYFDFLRRGGAEYFGAEMSAGVIRFIKQLQQTDPASAYTITTPTALISVEPTDRPADFVVNVFNPKQTSVTVIWGKVRVKNISDAITPERIVQSCQRVDVDEGKEPSKVIGVSSQVLKDLIKQTTIPRTLPEDVPQCRQEYVQDYYDFYIPDIPLYPLPRCGQCEVWNGDNCVPCWVVGMECQGGRCVRRECPPCTIWDGHRCIPCREIGRECINGRCQPPRCRSCSVWDGNRCVPCRELGMECRNGGCIKQDCGPCTIRRWDRCVPCSEIGMTCAGGRCVPKDCPPCSIWDGHSCVSCTALGKECQNGRCVSKRDCPNCTFWNGQRCVSCAEIGKTCENGKCVSRPCGACQMRRGDHCVSCESQGFVCIQGQCIRPIGKPGDDKKEPHKPPFPPPGKPEKPDLPDKPDKPSKPDGPLVPGLPPIGIPTTPVIPPRTSKPEIPDTRPGKPDIKPDKPTGTGPIVPGKTEGLPIPGKMTPEKPDRVISTPGKPDSPGGSGSVDPQIPRQTPDFKPDRFKRPDRIDSPSGSGIIKPDMPGKTEGPSGSTLPGRTPDIKIQPKVDTPDFKPPKLDSLPDFQRPTGLDSGTQMKQEQRREFSRPEQKIESTQPQRGFESQRSEPQRQMMQQRESKPDFQRAPAGIPPARGDKPGDKPDDQIFRGR